MEENSIIKDIGRSYIVSSFIPAALFAILSFLIFRDFIPHVFTNRLPPGDNHYIGEIGLGAIFITWLGFGLYSGQNWTIQFFEGYYFFKSLSDFLVHSQREDHRKAKESIAKLKETLENIPGSSEDEIKRQRNKAFVDMQQLEASAPLDENLLLPTRLGNVFRASEVYPYERYNLEGLTAWPRLIRFFPKEFSDQVEEKNNQFLFLLNSSLLCFLISGACLFVSILRVPCYMFSPSNLIRLYPYFLFACTNSQIPNNFFQKGFTNITETKYFILGIISFIVAYFFYRIAVISAKVLASLIRTGFDLYRLDLLKHLRIKEPKNLSEERVRWDVISEFLVAGDALGKESIKLKYASTDDLSRKEQETTQQSIEIGRFIESYIASINQNLYSRSAGNVQRNRNSHKRNMRTGTAAKRTEQQKKSSAPPSV